MKFQDYDRAEEVLEPNAYPADARPLKKLDMLKRQYEAIEGLVPGSKFYRVKQTTRFTEGPNSTGVYMESSTLSGMDCTGLNDGSKSSTLVNYLSDAWNWGAEMFCVSVISLVCKLILDILQSGKPAASRVGQNHSDRPHISETTLIIQIDLDYSSQPRLLKKKLQIIQTVLTYSNGCRLFLVITDTT